MKEQNSRLADILIRTGLVTPKQLEQVVQEQQRWGGRLLPLFIELGFVHEEQLVKMTSNELRIPIAVLDATSQISSDALRRIPVAFCEKYDVLPLSYDGVQNLLQVALTDPTEFSVLQELQSFTGSEIEPCIASISALRKAIRVFYYGESPSEQTDSQGSGVNAAPRPGYHSGAEAWAQHDSGIGETSALGPSAVTASFEGNSQQVSSSAFNSGFGGFSAPTGVPVTGAPPGTPSSGTPAPMAGGYNWNSPRTPSLPYSPGESNRHPNSNSSAYGSVSSEAESVPMHMYTALERKVATLEGEVAVLKEILEPLEDKFSEEFNDIQQLLRSRFHEQRMLVRGLFDLLVSGGYLKKEDIVKMLNQIAQEQNKVAGKGDSLL